MLSNKHSLRLCWLKFKNFCFVIDYENVCYRHDNVNNTFFGNLSRLQNFSLIYTKGWETTLPKTEVKHTKLNLLFITTMAQVWPISTLIQFENKLFQIELRLTIIAVIICISFSQVQKFEHYSFLDLQVRLWQYIESFFELHLGTLNFSAFGSLYNSTTLFFIQVH